MIRDLLEPLVSERFQTDARYREGHLRILNALPEKEVLGMHSPEMKTIAKRLSVMDGSGPRNIHDGCRTVNADAGNGLRGMSLIAAFESADPKSLCYEEIAVWGFMINFMKCPVGEKLRMLDRYVPVMDNWGVCDSFVSNAKWMKKVEPDVLLEWIDKWFCSGREFEVRFAIIVSMCYLIDSRLDEIFTRLDSLDFDRIHSDYCFAKTRIAEIQFGSSKKHPSEIQSGCSLGPEPYYVRMAVAWFLATALAKHPDRTRVYVNSCKLPPDVLKLYARKARESFRTRTVSPF